MVCKESGLPVQARGRPRALPRHRRKSVLPADKAKGEKAVREIK